MLICDQLSYTIVVFLLDCFYMDFLLAKRVELWSSNYSVGSSKTGTYKLFSVMNGTPSWVRLVVNEKVKSTVHQIFVKDQFGKKTIDQVTQALG